MPTMGKRTMNIHITNSINCRRENQIQDVIRTKENVVSETHWVKPDETKASTNDWVVGSKSPWKGWALAQLIEGKWKSPIKNTFLSTEKLENKLR